MQTPTVTSTPPEVAALRAVDVVFRPFTALEPDRILVLTGTVATAG
jgi:hypothetical protein